MNSIKCFVMALAILLVAVKSPHSFAQTDPVVTEEVVTLELGVVDTQEYGRNFGRDGNTSRLDVSFTSVVDLNHRLSWQAFDIERDEMLIFLNDAQIRTALTTTANRLGSVDGVTIQSADLVSGVNVLSFRVVGGDETWGVTNLSADAIAANVDGEAATTVLLDAPDQDGPVFGGVGLTQFTFDFSSRGTYYDETISISFDSYVAFNGINGFDLSLNGRRIKRVNSYRGLATFITQRVSLDKSEVLEGENTVTIQIFTSNGGSSVDAGFANVSVLSASVPLLDVSVTEVSVDGEVSVNKAIDAQATIINIGAKISPLNTLTFFVSQNDDKSNPVAVANTSVSAIVGGNTELIVQVIEPNRLRRGQYLWACLDRIAEDLIAANDCSPVVLLTGDASVTAPMIMLLLDD